MDLQSISTKGKTSNPPWDHARPALGSEVPSPAAACYTRKELPPCPGREQRLASCCGLSHTPGQGHGPSCAVLPHPGLAHTPLSLGCLAAPPGQRGSRRDLCIVEVPPCFICSYQWESGVYVCFLKGGGVRPKLVLVALGQFAICLLFSSLGAMGQNLPGGVLGSSAWSGVCSVCPGIPQLPPTPQNPGAEAAPPSKPPQFLAQEARPGRGAGAAASSSSSAGSSSLLCPCLTLGTAWER